MSTAARKKQAARQAKAKANTGGKASRQKGDRFERECVNFLVGQGIFTERVPLSGSAGGSFSADLQVTLRPHIDAPFKFECKMRKRAWKELYDWLQGNFGLFIRCNNQESLVVLRLSDFAALHGETW